MSQTLLESFLAAAMHVPVLIEAYDAQHRPVFWNSMAALVSGYDVDEVLGNPRAMEKMYPDPKYLRQMQRVFSRRGDNFEPMTWRLKCKGGEIRTIAWFNVSKFLKIPGWARWAIGVDVTEKMQIEEELKRQQKTLESQVKKNAEIKVALRVVLEHLELETKRVGRNLANQLDQQVTPFLNRLKDSRMTDQQKKWLEISMDNLHLITEMAEPSRLSAKAKLTAAEYEVALMIRKGMSTAEIADNLNLSEATVSSHRQHIRRKLGLTGQKVNLSQKLRDDIQIM